MEKMGKKESKVKKLVLSKETIRLLSGENLQEVVGGMRKASADTYCDNANCWGNPGTSDAC